MNMKKSLNKNISISYVYSFLIQLNVTSAIWVLYLAFKGMSLVQIGLIESIYHITSLLFELPTGAIADLYGKRFTLILGRILQIISSILMITANSFLGFTIAFLFCAAAKNLNSGSAEALVYDSLKGLNKEETYKLVWGKLAFFMSIAQGIAVLLGGILADLSFIYAYILGLTVEIIALIITFGFTEVTTENRCKENNVLIGQLITSVKVLKVRKVVLYLILFSALIGSLQTTVFFYCQKYFEDLDYTKTSIALICALGSLVEAIFSKYAYKIENFFKIKGIIIGVSMVNIIALFGLAVWKNLSVVFFLLTSIAGGLAYTILSDCINSRIPSEYRATILSVDSLCFSLFMICIFPLFGFIADKIGFTMTFGIVGGMYIPAIAFILLKLRKYKVIEDSEDLRKLGNC
ncbi:MFS transporter [Clostridium sp. 'White wine YQ']|uniref:MFS transporter n=1 Tax=Clostridium sp. 'White wine YQ' TaxID=3027474 RepID=UPI0023669A98|nr:MFS transporter [Clostridium sp. 'White wine YQ']MDD7795809.1 MFS transporter [Clostridium sp. 'White wine YQ']